MRSSLVHWLTLPKIWGRNAASVSPLRSGERRLATISPSGKAISAPATPSSAAARETTSLGVAYLATNLVPGRGAGLGFVFLESGPGRLSSQI